MSELRTVDLLRLFSRADAEFIVVGGVAGALFGSRMLTDDLDLVYARSEENYARILPVLADLEAIFRGLAGKVLAPTQRDLELNRINLLNTRLGDLDLLPTIGDGWTYDDLLPRSKWMQIEDFRVRVLRLATLIEAKTIANRPQDRAAVVVFRELLARNADPDPDAD